MKEFIDKLISRLEEERKKVNRDNKNKFCPTTDLICKESAFIQAISIVNQLAEEYKVPEMPTGWIPCEVELPKEDGYYLITIMYYHLHNPVVMGCCFEDGEWYKIDKDDKVLAWMPLPTPYQPKDCNTCANNTDFDEVDNGCYMCCKGYEDNYQPKGE